MENKKLNEQLYKMKSLMTEQEVQEDMLDDIKKYYPCSTCRWFQKGVDRLYLALIKYVYKYSKVELIHSQKTVEREGKKINTGMYVITCG